MDQSLLTFFKNLTCSLERGELCQRQLSTLGEFFMAYQFQEQVHKDNQTDSEETQKDREDYTRSEMIKFLSLGWYVYQFLLRDQSLPTQHTDIEPAD